MRVRRGLVIAAVAVGMFAGAALLRNYLHPNTIVGWPAAVLLIGSIVGLAINRFRCFRDWK